MKKGFTFLITIIISGTIRAQAPTIEWQKCFGGTNIESGGHFQQTTDGGYIVAGTSNSNDGDVTGNHGGYDVWIVKLTASRDIQWQKSLGGTGGEAANYIQQTSDGGYIVAGNTDSNDGDITGNHGMYDYWIVKIDASGNIQWQKCFGGTQNDYAASIQQTTDGGYIVAGYAQSKSGDVTGNHGNNDYWILKLDATGTIQWQKCLGGTMDDRVYPYSIQQTTEGGYIVAGYTVSNDGDITGNHGRADYWVLKLNASGAIQWQKCLGGANNDIATSIKQTSDGGYIIAGYTYSNDGDVTGFPINGDYWIVKIDASGTIQWQKIFGGTENDYPAYIQQTTDGGYIVAGFTRSKDGDVMGYHDGTDSWIVKLDATGTLKWQKCMGGGLGDWAYSIQQTPDGGYIGSGYSWSNSGDVTGNHGSSDFWLAKLSPDVTSVSELVSDAVNIYPNPVENLLYVTSSNPNHEIILTNLLGEILFHEKATGGRKEIDVSHLPSGMYFVNNRKFMKE